MTLAAPGNGLVAVRPIEEATPSQLEQWNDLVRSAAHGHLRQGHEYGLSRRDLGWKPVFVWTEAQGGLVAGALVLTKSAAGGAVTIASVPSGPVWRPGGEGYVAGLLAAIGEHCRREGAIFCRLSPVCATEEWMPLIAEANGRFRVSRSSWSYWDPPRARMVADLSGDFMARVAPDARTKIRRGPRRGVTVTIGGREAVPDLARLRDDMRARKHVLVRQGGYLHSLFAAYPPDRIKIFSAVAEGKTIAAALAVVFGPTAYYLEGAFDYSFRKLYPTEVLQHAIMQWAQESGCRSYDMGGTCTDWPVSKSDKGYGVYQFKKSLGASTFLASPYTDIVCRPWLYQAAFAAEHVAMPLVLETGRDRIQVMKRRWRENSDGLRVVDLFLRFCTRVRYEGLGTALRRTLDAAYPRTFGIYLRSRSGAAEEKTQAEIRRGADALAEMRKSQTTGLPSEFMLDRTRGEKECCVAVKDGGLAGVLWLFDEGGQSPFLELGPNDVELGALFVQPDARGHGIATALIAEAARAATRTRLWASIDDRNLASKRAFEKAGFARVATLERAALWGRRFKTADVRSVPAAGPR
jgi:lipid II:glycine glycyltransferase (peptidoglycan interpeptide bridge formation enzyme)/GNAT superfamily N-acetyltransferase